MMYLYFYFYLFINNYKSIDLDLEHYFFNYTNKIKIHDNIGNMLVLILNRNTVYNIKPVILT